MIDLGLSELWERLYASFMSSPVMTDPWYWVMALSDIFIFSGHSHKRDD